jgi:ankyrin repeat protein
MTLETASKEGDLNKVKELIEQGADIHADDFALRWASYYGHLVVVKYLVEQGANIHALNDCAIRWASENGHLDVVKYLKRVIKLRNISVKSA